MTMQVLESARHKVAQLLGGVEDVEEGERYSVVTWLVGPWFK